MAPEYHLGCSRLIHSSACRDGFLMEVPDIPVTKVLKVATQLPFSQVVDCSCMLQEAADTGDRLQKELSMLEGAANP